MGGIGVKGAGAPADTPEPRWTDDDPITNEYISYASKGWSVSFLPGSSNRSVLTDNFPSDTAIACDDTRDPPNHRDGFNVLFADTHVEFLSDQRFDTSQMGNTFSTGDPPSGGQDPLDMITN